MYRNSHLHTIIGININIFSQQCGNLCSSTLADLIASFPLGWICVFTSQARTDMREFSEQCEVQQTSVMNRHDGWNNNQTMMCCVEDVDECCCIFRFALALPETPSFLFQLVFMVLKLQCVSASRSPPFVLFVDQVLMCTGQNVKLSSQKGENVN